MTDRPKLPANPDGVVAALHRLGGSGNAREVAGLVNAVSFAQARRALYGAAALGSARPLGEGQWTVTNGQCEAGLIQRCTSRISTRCGCGCGLNLCPSHILGGPHG